MLAFAHPDVVVSKQVQGGLQYLETFLAAVGTTGSEISICTNGRIQEHNHEPVRHFGS